MGEYAVLLGSLGLALAMSLTCIGAAYGTARAGVGIMSMGLQRPDMVMRSLLPVIMAGIIGLYGLISVMAMLGSFNEPYPTFRGALHLAAGLIVGVPGLAAGIAIGVVGDAGVRATVHQPQLYIAMLIVLIFAEVLGLYGVVLALMLNNKGLGQ